MKTKQKWLVFSAIGLVLLVAIAGVVGVVGRLFAPAPVVSVDRPTSSTPAQEDETEPEPESGRVQDSEFELSLTRDEFGMVTMPQTTDPVTAAAGAAAVALNVDIRSLTAMEFLDEAVHRMTHPAPGYVGPEGEVHTNNPIRYPGLQGYEYWPADHALTQRMRACYVMDPLATPCTHWQVMNNGAYDQLRHDVTSIYGSPVMVMSQDEFDEWWPDNKLRRPGVPSFPTDEFDSTPDSKGATISNWIVVSEYQFDFDDPDSFVYVGMHFGIWCDPPEKGGLCGVAWMFNPKLPTAWPLRS